MRAETYSGEAVRVGAGESHEAVAFDHTLFKVLVGSGVVAAVELFGP